jgi:hypothetical protein
MQQTTQSPTRHTHETPEQTATSRFAVSALLAVGLLTVVFVPMFVVGAVLGVGGYKLASYVQQRETVHKTDRSSDSTLHAKHTA